MQKQTIAQNAACNAVVSLVNVGSINSSGRLYLYTSDATVISYLPFSTTAFRDATDGTSVANTIRDATAYMDATASTFGVVNRDATTIWTGTVTNNSGNGDMKLNSTVIFKDSTVSISNAYYAVPR